MYLESRICNRKRRVHVSKTNELEKTKTLGCVLGASNLVSVFQSIHRPVQSDAEHQANKIKIIRVVR